MNSTHPNYVSAGCIWRPKRGEYVGRHFWYNPETGEARSYGWWSMLLRIGNRLVMNECRYSNQTAKDFTRLYYAMMREGVEADCSIYCREGLNNLSQRTVSEYEFSIAELEAAIARPRSHAITNERRREQISKLKRGLKLAKSLLRVKLEAEKRRYAA